MNTLKQALVVFKIVCSVTIISIFQTSYSQIGFRHYGGEDGYMGYGAVQFAQDSLGFLWVRTMAGLYQFDGFEFKMKVADTMDSLSLPYNLTYGVSVDPNGRVWVSYQKYLRAYERDVDGFREYDQLFDILSISFDKGGNTLWIGTEGKGLMQLNIETKNSVNYLNNLESLAFHADVNSILHIRNSKDNLLLGTKRGLWLFNKLTKQFTKPEAFDRSSLANSEILKIFSHKDYYWLQTSTGLVQVDSSFRIFETFKFQQIFEKFDPSKNLVNPKITGIDQDTNGIFWIASNGLGLIRYDPHNGSLANFRHDPSDPLTLLSDELVAIMVDREQNIWVAESPNNISVLMKHNVTFYNYFYPVSLRYDQLFIKSVYKDTTGRLWILALQGLFCYDRKTRYYMRFTEEDRAQATRFRSGSTSIVVKGFSGAKSNFDHGSLHVSMSSPRPLITGLKVNNKKAVSRKSGGNEFLIPRSINLLDELVLDHTQNVFSLEFAAMQLASPKRNLYRYKLEDFDTKWIETAWTNRTATYMNLDPGNYVFRVKASNEDNIWNDSERTLRIKILPPPWRTWWAYSFYGLFFIAVLLMSRRNIIQRERLTTKLEVERVGLEKAKEVDRLKSSFFTNISHEFRTPLTLIKGPVEILEEEFRDNPKVIDKLNGIHQNADQLLKLINQLLDLARVESGNLKIEQSESDLKTFLNQIAQSFSSHAAQKGINYAIKGPAQNFKVKLDQGKVEVICVNLIANALKFTKRGGSVSFKAEVEKNDQLIITVSDTGVGIQKNELDHIFERFYQVSSSHQEAGTGIGLALVKNLTELMGGEVKVTSEEGKGSEFRVVLPVEIIEVSTQNRPIQEMKQIESFATEANVEWRLEHSSKPKVLIVEDNRDLQFYIMESLGDRYDFLSAENGKLGLNNAIEEIPDLIISDVMMPEMDGMEMMQAIKKDIRTSHIPVILLTAKATEADKLLGLDFGADDYLTKPFNRSELVLKVRNSIALQSRLRANMKLQIEQVSSQPEVPSGNDRFLARVKTAIFNRISDEQLSVESLAEELGMSRVQLYRKLSGLTGLSVIELIREYRLQHASTLLRKGATVAEAAFEIGFSNYSHFSRLFKDKFGMFPSEYPGKQG